MKKIGIVEILELINKCLPCCYYFILFMDENERKKYINNSLLRFFIEDLALIELTSNDKSLEKYLNVKLGKFPIRVGV